MNTRWTIKPLHLACVLAFSSQTHAEIFNLGEIQVVAARQDAETGADTLVQDEMRQFNRETVGKALNVLPGITSTEGGPRNEQMLTIRGFDLRQVPVFVDGIPVYVSYDGYVDLGRFNTFDLAKIDVAKGFSSVLYGPNTLGGAVNLVSRKPSKHFEGDVTVGLYRDRNLGNTGFHSDLNAGGNHDTWYWQASTSYLDRNQYRLSNDFLPTRWENGGSRENSYSRDKKINLKVGLTPLAGDEYTINYINQQGTKGTPVYAGTDVASTNAARFWQWPYWNKESLYLVSRTGIGANSYIKARAYYDKFQNSIQNFTDGTYTALAARPFLQSWYDDYSVGASMEFGTKLAPSNALKLAAHVKNDIHREHNQGNPTQYFKDRTTSFGIEDSQKIGDKFELIAGVSHDARETRQAQNFLAGQIVDFQAGSAAAWNPQAGLFFRPSATDEIHFTVSRKSRFPTIKDRYSYRLGTAIPNATLQPEKALNYELGGSTLVGETIKLTGAIFYYDVKDMIQAVTLTPATLCGGAPATCTQMQNVGNVQTKGAELGISSYLGESVELGANFTVLNRYNKSDPGILLIDVPHQKLFTYAKWQVSGPLSILGSVEANSRRFSTTTGSRIAGGFGIANLKAQYQFSPTWSVDFGVNNLMDRNYMVIEGYPLEGRNFFANSTWKF